LVLRSGEPLANHVELLSCRSSFQPPALAIEFKQIAVVYETVESGVITNTSPSSFARSSNGRFEMMIVEHFS